MLWIVLTFVAVAIGYYYLKKPHRYWLERGVPQGNPTLIFGHNLGTVMQKQSFAEMIEMVYNIAPKSRYCGIYQFFTPTLVLRDPDLIRQITVKDFDHFVDHRTFATEANEPLFSKNLFSLHGQQWRDMRSTLSPAFTSSKMKFMFSLISKNGQRFAEHFVKKSEDIITLEMKDAFTRFTNDVIANSAFGVECDSLDERGNEFFLMGKEATDFNNFWKNIKFLILLISPKIAQVLKISLFSSQVSNFFVKVVKDNLESREKYGIVRPDMIHLLMEARKHGFKPEEASALPDTGFATVQETTTPVTKAQKAELTDMDIAAQALVFFFAGFDSVSALMCFISYELGINPDIQERLIQEVDDTLEACNGTLTYEALLDMKYMDMVVSETLRKWPNALAVDRVCTKPYTIQPTRPDEKPIHFKKNDVLFLPIFGIHRDPEKYPDPLKFDPERFSDENKANIKPYTYFPFGSGPRSCIGSRFALLETKTLFFYILMHFEIVPVEKTQIPIVLNKKSISLNAENGFWFGLKRRRK